MTYLGGIETTHPESPMTRYEIEQKARELRAQTLRNGLLSLRRLIAARLTARPFGRTA